ncbi:hypothetical protein GQX73_g6883 [Xylaria multiplex]|uniref:Uncharacterized protein n=1 Tax=Xylaria multiplex TaxID=323545 RepID=A0A7C8MK32_9PEZI|nr:hypothetical protein GQX73_g6883 [Xylaria multiplex]
MTRHATTNYTSKRHDKIYQTQPDELRERVVRPIHLALSLPEDAHIKLESIPANPRELVTTFDDLRREYEDLRRRLDNFATRLCDYEAQSYDIDTGLRNIDVLNHLGFGYETSVSILECWNTLRDDAPAGGPYKIIGVALATIAELGETEMPECHGQVVGSRNAPARSEWAAAFAQILNDETLAAAQRVGAYLAPDFTQAKWLVHHMVLRRWEQLVRRTDVTNPYTTKAVPIATVNYYWG